MNTRFASHEILYINKSQNIKPDPMLDAAYYLKEDLRQLWSQKDKESGAAFSRRLDRTGQKCRYQDA